MQHVVVYIMNVSKVTSGHAFCIIVHSFKEPFKDHCIVTSCPIVATPHVPGKESMLRHLTSAWQSLRVWLVFGVFMKVKFFHICGAPILVAHGRLMMGTMRGSRGRCSSFWLGCMECVLGVFVEVEFFSFGGMPLLATHGRLVGFGGRLGLSGVFLFGRVGGRKLDVFMPCLMPLIGSQMKWLRFRRMPLPAAHGTHGGCTMFDLVCQKQQGKSRSFSLTDCVCLSGEFVSSNSVATVSMAFSCEGWFNGAPTKAT
mmetsp:Transcript_6295/g.14037  ORF Transcript_6295/g.14037 Transcript_6295/m.14037 type:complete len:256 (-) Transcript_6295:16-783(-)